MSNPFVIEPLTGQHRLQGFGSGEAALDHYLHERALPETAGPQSDCFVAVDEHGAIAGFYTFATTSIALTELSADERGSLPRSGIIQVGRIAHLAVDQNFRERGLAGALIMDAAFRAAQTEPMVFALLVDATSETALQIYEHLGFVRLKSLPATLFIPLETGLKAARAPRASVVPSSRR